MSGGGHDIEMGVVVDTLKWRRCCVGLDGKGGVVEAMMVKGVS